MSLRISLRFAALLLLALVSSAGHAQGRQEREGITLYWGLVPSAIASDAQLHGGPRQDGGQPHHLVVALFDAATGRRIENAVVRAQLTESGIADAPPKYLPPMPVNGMASYGQWFTTVRTSGPYRFRVFVKLDGRPGEIEFDILGGVPHEAGR